MQLGQSAPIMKVVWNASQWQKITASAVPARTSCQNSFGNLTPKKSATAITNIIANVATPIREFGKPNTSACFESMTLLQFKVELMLHDGVYPESLSTLNLSYVRMKEARKPEMDATRRVQAEVLFFSSMWQEYRAILF